jgi:uncharacterized phage protein (TIGR01671 family)
MNDRFKFRVWDVKNKCFISNCPRFEESEHWYPELYINASGEAWGMYRSEHCPGEINYETHHRHFNSPDYIVMQCTGLKDSEGKLIYEGDILSYHEWWRDEEDKIIQVKLGKFESCGCCSKVCGVGFDFGINIDISEDDTLKIIGNIYENKELLNGK